MEELNTVDIGKIKAEANILLKNLDKILEDIDSVTNIEEAIEFDKNHQYDEELTYLKLDW